jgi:hypothetical protein
MAGLFLFELPCWSGGTVRILARAFLREFRYDPIGQITGSETSCRTTMPDS